MYFDVRLSIYVIILRTFSEMSGQYYLFCFLLLFSTYDVTSAFGIVKNNVVQGNRNRAPGGHVTAPILYQDDQAPLLILENVRTFRML